MKNDKIIKVLATVITALTVIFMFSLIIGFSWLVAFLFLKLIAWTFDIVLSWKVITGIWLVSLILWIFFKK